MHYSEIPTDKLGQDFAFHLWDNIFVSTRGLTFSVRPRTLTENNAIPLKTIGGLGLCSVSLPGPHFSVGANDSHWVHGSSAGM